MWDTNRTPQRSSAERRASWSPCGCGGQALPGRNGNFYHLLGYAQCCNRQTVAAAAEEDGCDN